VDEKSRLANIKVGVFVLGALAILIAGSLWIAGSTFFGAERVPYVVLMQDSGGLQGGDRVRVAGVAIGRIQRVDLRPGDPWPVALHVAVKPDVPIKTDSTARVATSGLLGASYLLIESGSPNSAALPAGGEIHSTSSPGLEDALTQVGRVSEKVLTILDQASGLLDTLSGEMGPILANLESLVSENNAEDVALILGNLRATTNDAGPKVAVLLERLDAVAEQLEGGIEGLPGLANKLSTLAENVEVALGPDGERLARMLESATNSLNSAEEAMSVIGGNRAEIESTLRDLRDTVANLKDFSRQVKEHPFSIVRIKPEPERRPGQGVKKKENR
jgi:phospholipid/cholesterol/gamma-HCH transport system substrate-binding protein